MYIGFPLIVCLVRIWAVYTKQEYIFVEKVWKREQDKNKNE
jgi:hypothetical protein